MNAVRGRGPSFVLALGVLLLLAFFAGRWAEDVVAPYLNEGEARIGDTVEFEANAGRYRVVTSGPSRPEIDRTKCEIVLGDGSTIDRIGGEGTVSPHERLGVSRVIEFDAVKGETTVECFDRISPSARFGRFQVVDASDPFSIGVRVAGWAGLAALLLGLAWVVLRRAAAAGGDPGVASG